MDYLQPLTGQNVSLHIGLIKHHIPCRKKWKRTFSPYFNSETITGSTENGLGGEYRMKRTDKDSALRIGTFGKLSTTQEENKSRYHLSFGSSLKYTKNIGSKSAFKAAVDIKDRITFGKGNIYTASGSAKYFSPKVNAETEIKHFIVSGDEKSSYFGITGKVFYTPCKTVNFYTEAAFTNMKQDIYNIQGTTLQAGAIFYLNTK